jgi:uncharacterized protein (TIGR00288 family)
MSTLPDAAGAARVAVLVDCDNTTPDALGYALRAVARFGRIVVRRGYGNHGTLTAKWREALVDHAFTPHLQFQYAAGKNTADIAMAIDAVELLFDARADTFCLVTSDSDFAYLCRKLRERGAQVCIVGEQKTPDALKNASDQFFELELLRAEFAAEGAPAAGGADAPLEAKLADVASAVASLAADSSDGWVNLSSVNGLLKRTDPGFDPKRFGFTRFRDLVKAHPRLEARQEGSQWWVRLQEAPKEAKAAAKKPARRRSKAAPKDSQKTAAKKSGEA